MTIFTSRRRTPIPIAPRKDARRKPQNSVLRQVRNTNFGLPSWATPEAISGCGWFMMMSWYEKLHRVRGYNFLWLRVGCLYAEGVTLQSPGLRYSATLGRPTLGFGTPSEFHKGLALWNPFRVRRLLGALTQGCSLALATRS